MLKAPIQRHTSWRATDDGNETSSE